MAQANIKERIKEMRLRVLAEPLEDVTVQDGEPHLDAKIETSIPDTSYIKKPKNNIEEGNTGKKNKLAKKKNSKSKKKIPDKNLIELSKNNSQQVQVNKPETANDETQIKEFSVGQENQIEEKSTEQTSLAKNTQAENDQQTDDVINLTDKWVEFEVRSRLSGLEQQEKQTRAMVKEIVDVLDRIEALEHVKPQEQTPILSANKPSYQKSEAKKMRWLKIIKRFFVITGTFLVLTGIIWGILIYLLF